MKIDTKYFIPFIGIAAAMTALIIVFFTISNRSSKEKNFSKRIFAQDSLKYQAMAIWEGTDSLQVSSFKGKYVVLDFWSTWSETFTKEAHRQLSELKKAYPDDLEIVAAVVRDKPENIDAYIRRHHFPFHYVEGTSTFNKFDVAGVPTQLVYAPDGKLSSIFTGYADSIRMDSLRTMVTHKK